MTSESLTDLGGVVETASDVVLKVAVEVAFASAFEGVLRVSCRRATPAVIWKRERHRQRDRRILPRKGRGGLISDSSERLRQGVCFVAKMQCSLR